MSKQVNCTVNMRKPSYLKKTGGIKMKKFVLSLLLFAMVFSLHAGVFASSPDGADVEMEEVMEELAEEEGMSLWFSDCDVLNPSTGQQDRLTPGVYTVVDNYQTFTYIYHADYPGGQALVIYGDAYQEYENIFSTHWITIRNCISVWLP